MRCILGELLYGLAKRGHPAVLGALIHEFLIRMAASSELRVQGEELVFVR